MWTAFPERDWRLLASYEKKVEQKNSRDGPALPAGPSCRVRAKRGYAAINPECGWTVLNAECGRAAIKTECRRAAIKNECRRAAINAECGRAATNTEYRGTQAEVG